MLCVLRVADEMRTVANVPDEGGLRWLSSCSGLGMYFVNSGDRASFLKRVQDELVPAQDCAT